MTSNSPRKIPAQAMTVLRRMSNYDMRFSDLIHDRAVLKQLLQLRYASKLIDAKGATLFRITRLGKAVLSGQTGDHK